MSLSCVRLFATSWTVAYQAPLSVEYSRQEYWSGLPCSTLPGASVRNSAMAKVMRKEASAYAKRDQASGNPLFQSIYPQNQSPPTLLLYALTYTSDFMGGCPPPPLSEKELTSSSKSIKIPGYDKSVSIYKLLCSFSSLPEQVRPATCDCLQPPNHERHKML